VAPLALVLSAASGSLALVAATFFVRFARDTRDRFFAYFAAAFAVLGAHWLLLALLRHEGEVAPLHYSLRVFAFGLIAIAIARKNGA